jgi:hypothetical protein
LEKTVTDEKQAIVLGGDKPLTEAEVKEITSKLAEVKGVAPKLVDVWVCTADHGEGAVTGLSGVDGQGKVYDIDCRTAGDADIVRHWLRLGGYAGYIKDEGGLLSPEDYPAHPAAKLFPLMGDGDLAELAADIKTNGLRHAVIVYQCQVLDGRNRLAACKLAGVGPRVRFVTEADIGYSPIDFVLSCNLHRRHLTTEQKRQVIAAILKADPTRSNRQVAGKVGADHKTVASVREEAEGREEIPHVATTTDTKGRKQPAGRKRRKTLLRLAGEEAAGAAAAHRAVQPEPSPPATAPAEPVLRVFHGETAGPVGVNPGAGGVGGDSPAGGVAHDQAGVPLPPRVAEAFDRLTELGELCDLLTVAARKLEKYRKGPAGVRFGDFRFRDFNGRAAPAKLRELRDVLRELRPAHVCPTCPGGKTTHCATCHGRGWLTDREYERAVADLAATTATATTTSG